MDSLLSAYGDGRDGEEEEDERGSERAGTTQMHLPPVPNSAPQSERRGRPPAPLPQAPAAMDQYQPLFQTHYHHHHQGPSHAQSVYPHHYPEADAVPTVAGGPPAKRKWSTAVGGSLVEQQQQQQQQQERRQSAGAPRATPALRPYEPKRTRNHGGPPAGLAQLQLPLLQDEAAAAVSSSSSLPLSATTTAAAAAAAAATATTTSSSSTARLVHTRLPSTLFNRTLRPQKAAANKTRLVQRITRRFTGLHTGPVNTCRWSSTHGVLLATASMDKTIRVWDAFAAVSDAPGGCVAALRDHSEAVMDVRWNADNTRLLSGSFDKTALLTDLETCTPIHSFKHKEMITTVSWHPEQPEVFLAGAYRHGIACWDARTNRVVAQFKGEFGSVQAIEWLHGGGQFVSSSDITKRNSIDKSILVWDFNHRTVLSNQVYQEAYTCPSLRVHPDGAHFVAQSNAGYIAIFSSQPPFKLNKFKRFEGHQVEGYRIGCDISADGSLVATGSANGFIHFYSWYSGKEIKTLSTASRAAPLPSYSSAVLTPPGNGGCWPEACIHVAFHPLHPQVMASCGWDGSVLLLGSGVAGHDA